MEITDVTLLQVAMLLVACLIATYIRIKDEPATPWNELGWKGLAEIFIGVLIAGFLGMWMLMTQDILVDTWQGFIAVVGIAYGGVAGVRALLNTVKKVEPPPVA
jgi:hypothetical protein